MGTKKQFERDEAFKSQKLKKTTARRRALERERDVADQTARSRRNDLIPRLSLEQVPLSDLRHSDHRARRSAPEQVARLTASIADLGFTAPILVSGGEIIDGHVRVEAAARLGLDRVPAIEVTHLSPTEVRKLRLALNRTAELGEWDLDRLHDEMRDLTDLEVDLGSTGFTVQDVDIILLDGEDAQEDGADEVIAEADGPVVARSGDVWVLGEHRIVCGDALAPETLSRVLGDRPVHLVLTDPPYNVPIAGNVSGLGRKTHDEFAMASGEMNETEWQAFLDRTVAALAGRLVEGGVMFAFMDWRSIHRLYAAGSAAGLRVANLVVWYKQAGAMGGLYRSAHELIAVFCKGATPRTNNVELGRHGRNRTNVWEAPGANRRGSSANEMLEFHATPKPVELCADAILDVTERGDLVLDIFLGSGTTLVAAEKTGRACRGVEIEPRFVDVAIRRWERLTGKAAVLEGAGETFSEIGLSRQADGGDAEGAGHD